MGREIEVVDEVIKKVSAGELHPEIARIAIKGAIVELMDAHEAEIRAKDERIAGLKKALKLAEAKPQKKVVKVRKAYAYKEKYCKSCGKKFVPRYGAQTICDACKDKVLPVDDIRETAKALAEM